jgi:hypothetical protein
MRYLTSFSGSQACICPEPRHDLFGASTWNANFSSALTVAENTCPARAAQNVIERGRRLVRSESDDRLAEFRVAVWRRRDCRADCEPQVTSRGGRESNPPKACRPSTDFEDWCVLRSWSIPLTRTFVSATAQDFDEHVRAIHARFTPKHLCGAVLVEDLCGITSFTA